MSASGSSGDTAGARRSRPAAAFELVRPLNLVIAACASIVGAWLQAGRALAPGPAVWSAAAVVAAVAGANAINDWADGRADAVNRPGRPVPSGALSPRAALVTAIAAYAAAIALATRVSIPAVDVVVLWVLITVAYSVLFKSIPVLGNVVVAVVTASVVYLGSLSQGRPMDVPVVWAFALAFLFILAREFAKDAEDVAGDRVQGVRTLATVLGEGSALTAARCTIFVAMLAVAAPLALRVFGVWYGLAAVVVEGLLAVALHAIAPSRKAASPGRASAVLKMAMVAGLAAVTLGMI